MILFTMKADLRGCQVSLLLLNEFKGLINLYPLEIIRKTIVF